MQIRPLLDADHDAVLALNQGALPAVSHLDRQSLAALVGQSQVSLVIDAGPAQPVAGFIVVLGPGADYASLNYRWFSERYDSFAYIDRVVVDADHRGQGLGERLYDEVRSRAGASAPWLLAEVNIRPRNDGSLRFHDRLGFVAVGEQETEGGAKAVRMLARSLSPEKVSR